jgi:hypothetical protein
MTRRIAVAMVVFATILVAAPSFAHDEYRIIGTVLKRAAGTLDVKQTKDGKTISMTLDDKVPVSRDKKKMAISDVKVGTSVVVDALGDSLEDLSVVEIMIVPAAAK